MAIYFIRHGQSEFNAVFDGERDPMIFDAPLTELGCDQAKRARAKIAKLGIRRVIVSPFTRAIQTARIIFEGLAPLEVRHGHHELLLNSCDVGRDAAQLKTEFPDLDFDHLPHRWWHHETGLHREIAPEPMPLFQKRIAAFVAELEEMRNRPIAVVGHGNAFKEIIGRAMDNCELHQYR